MNVFEPDLLVVLKEQAGIVTDKHVRGAPAVVVEVLSPDTRRRDLTTKRRIYPRDGVREYWVVDPDARTIQVWRWREGAESAVEFGAVSHAVLTSECLLGLEVDVAGLFTRAHRD